ncbi:MAG TPA: ATP-binding protein [Clostridia bacterium]|nr:ATP-binding protein [Clostridia bacterium]
MKELSMHILDIAQNSVHADSKLVEIEISENIKKNILEISIKDDGKGMDEETLKKVTDPFYTSRTTRKVGLGIPMLKSAAETCDGSFSMKSEVGKGTELTASFRYDHIDRAPLGNIVDTVVTVVISDINIDFIYRHHVDDRCFKLDTREIKEVLGDVPLNNVDVICWIKDHIKEGIEKIEQ